MNEVAVQLEGLCLRSAALQLHEQLTHSTCRAIDNLWLLLVVHAVAVPVDKRLGDLLVLLDQKIGAALSNQAEESGHARPHDCWTGGIAEDPA